LAPFKLILILKEPTDISRQEKSKKKYILQPSEMPSERVWMSFLAVENFFF